MPLNMPTRKTPAVEATVRLRHALEEVADSLATAKLGRLLSAESALERALPGLTGLATSDPQERLAIRHELGLARAALSRCQALGASLNEVVRVTFEALGYDTAYRTSGAPAEPADSAAIAGRSFSARV